MYVKSLGYFYNELLQPVDKKGDSRIEEMVQCLHNIWILHCRLHQDLIAQVLVVEKHQDLIAQVLVVERKL